MMDWLEYEMGYDKKTKEMIIFEFDYNGEDLSIIWNSIAMQRILGKLQ